MYCTFFVFFGREGGKKKREQKRGFFKWGDEGRLMEMMRWENGWMDGWKGWMDGRDGRR